MSNKTQHLRSALAKIRALERQIWDIYDKSDADDRKCTGEEMDRLQVLETEIKPLLELKNEAQRTKTMSISDVLFEAIDTIKSYQKDQPWMYGSYERKINKVVDSMEELLSELDAPPPSRRRRRARNIETKA